MTIRESQVPRGGDVPVMPLVSTDDKIRAAGKSAQLDEDHSVRLTREQQARHCH